MGCYRRAHTGIVTAFMTMSPTQDEIDLEHTTSDGTDFETNSFWNVAKYAAQYGSASAEKTVKKKLPPGFNVADWHTYTIEWTPSAITWSVDGNPVRTLTRKSTRASHGPRAGLYQYPATPSRIQVSLWDAGNSDNAEGTRQWAGGHPDWSHPDDAATGAFTAEISSLSIRCADPATLQGNGHAYDFSHAVDPSTGEPTVITSSRSTQV